MKPSLHKRKARPSYVGERWGENMHEGHFCLLSKSVLEISFSSSFRSLVELGWQRPSAPLACSLKKTTKKIPLFSQHGQISMVDRDQVFKMLKMEVLNSSWDFLAPWGSPNLCAISWKVLIGKQQLLGGIKGQPDQLLTVMKIIQMLCLILSCCCKSEAMFTSTKLAVCDLKCLVKYSIAIFS